MVIGDGLRSIGCRRTAPPLDASSPLPHRPIRGFPFFCFFFLPVTSCDIVAFVAACINADSTPHPSSIDHPQLFSGDPQGSASAPVNPDVHREAHRIASRA